MRRRLLVLPVAAATVVTLMAAGSPVQAASGDPYGSVRDILPPGQNGTVTATDAATVVATDPANRYAVDGKNAPANFSDQLEMYDGLNRVDPAAVDQATVDRYYKDAGFDLPASEVVRTEKPKAGVTIRWDHFGVPHITGATRADVAWGSGYAGTEDRMFLQDVLRHAGAARAAEFLGPTDANVEMDQEQLRSAYYTPTEAAQQVAALPQRYGAEGTRLVAAGDAFLAGINAAQDAMCPLGLPTGPRCPAEYAALQKKPAPWTRADLVYVASLVGGIFGKGGGAEYADALWLQKLESRFGAATGRAVYDDLREKDDAEAPTTASVSTPYGGPRGVDPDQPGVALPDVGGPTAPGTGSDAGGGLVPAPDLGSLTGTQAVEQPGAHALDAPFGRIDLGLHHSGMSNALLVSAAHTTSGHPVAVMGPQTGYYAPQLLTEEVLEGPGVKARGVAFAGTQLVVQLGRGVDYAWSATSASNDNVDTVAERLCNTDGTPATVQSTAYVVDGSCVPMQRDVHEETAIPNVSATGAPKTYKFLVLRTRHGIVQLRTTAKGTPVAIVLQRSTYGHEVDSIVGFARVNDPGYVHDPATFQDAMSAVDYTFNWFYADSQHISYFSSGLLPQRAAGTDFDLPRWGDSVYDWGPWLPQSAHVHQTDPSSGYLVSWNNKPAPGWSAADDVWGYGAVYRSLALSDRVEAAIADGKTVDAPRLDGLMADAMTVDSRAAYTLPAVLDVIGTPTDPQDARAVELLRTWLAAGAHRVDRDRDGAYSDQAAVAIADEWWESQTTSTKGSESLPRDVLAAKLGPLVTQLPQAVDDHPRIGRGSSWNGVAWYGYLSKDLRTLLGRTVTAPYSTAYCGDGDLAACRAQLTASLHGAVQRLLAAQQVASVDQLRYDKTQDDIRSVAAGVVGVRPIDWQNRPTFQQVVAFTGHR